VTDHNGQYAADVRTAYVLASSLFSEMFSSAYIYRKIIRPMNLIRGMNVCKENITDIDKTLD